MSKFRIAAAVVMIVLLSGCSTTYTDQQRDGGIAPSAAEDALLAIDGVTRAEYETVEWYNPGEGGLFSSEGMDVYLEVEIDADHSIADPEQFLDYLARTAWSVNDHYPQGAVTLVVTGGIAPYFDWLPVINDVFDLELTRVSDFSNSGNDRQWGDLAVPIAVSTTSYGDAFGRWPSARVSTPTGLLLSEAPDLPVVAAITDLVFETFDNKPQKEDCYRLTFIRSDGYEGEYPGDVTVELLSRSDAVLDSRVIDESSYHEFFCYPKGERPADASIRVSAPGSEWYSAVEQTLTAD